jgi:fatty-acid desaturase
VVAVTDLRRRNPVDPPSTAFVTRDGINWISVAVFTVFHAGAVAALFLFNWPAFFTTLVLYWISLSLGIGMGYHRLLTHRSYAAPNSPWK